MNEALKVILCHLVDLVWDLSHDKNSKSTIDLKFSKETEPKYPSYDISISTSPINIPSHFDCKKYKSSLKLLKIRNQLDYIVLPCFLATLYPLYPLLRTSQKLSLNYAANQVISIDLKRYLVNISQTFPLL